MPSVWSPLVQTLAFWTLAVEGCNDRSSVHGHLHCSLEEALNLCCKRGLCWALG